MEIKIENGAQFSLDDTEIGAEALFTWSDEDTNLVAKFSETKRGQAELKRLTDEIMELFTNEWDAQEEHREKTAADFSTFLGKLKPKSFPFENCANVNVPISYESIVRLTFRLFSELFGDMTNPVGVLPVGPDDEVEAILKSKHINYQMTEVIQDFFPQMFKALMMFIHDGHVTCHSFYDPVRRSNRHEVLGPDQFVVPNSNASLMPDYSDAPFVCRIHYYTKQQLTRMRGIWYGVDNLIGMKGSFDDDADEQPMAAAHSEVLGIEETVPRSVATHKIIQWVGWIDMPGIVKGEMAPRFMQAYIHYDSRVMLQLTVHEQASWTEIERFRREEAELKEYKEQFTNYTAAYSAMAGAQQAIIDNPDVPMEDKQTLSLQSTLPPPAPVPPQWLNGADPDTASPRELKKNPVYQFTKGCLIEPREGAIGFGFGRLLADLNVAANTLLDQYIDAATVANTNEIVTTSEVRFKKPFRTRPGYMHTVEATSSDLRNSIITLPKSPANPQLRELVETLVKWGQSAPQAPDILTGMPGKSGETLGGIQTRSGHAMKQLSAIARKFAGFVVLVYKQNARLNAIFLDEEEFFKVNNNKLGITETLRIGRAMYRGDYNVIFRSSLDFSTKEEKIAKADELVQMSLSVPFLAQNQLFCQKAIIKALEARDEHELAELVRQTPPVPRAVPAMQEQMPETTPPEM